MQELTQHEAEQAVSEIEFGDLNADQQAELERRMAAYRADPDGSTVSLEEAVSGVKAAIEHAAR